MLGHVGQSENVSPGLSCSAVGAAAPTGADAELSNAGGAHAASARVLSTGSKLPRRPLQAPGSAEANACIVSSTARLAGEPRQDLKRRALAGFHR